MYFKKKILIFVFLVIFSISVYALPIPYLGTGIEHRTEIYQRDWYTPSNQTNYNWTFNNIITIGNINTSGNLIISGSLNVTNLLVKSPPVECPSGTFMTYTNMTTSICVAEGTILKNSTSWNRTSTNVILANTGDNVGIGTTEPGRALHLYSSTATDFGMSISAPASDASTSIDLRANSTGQVRIQMRRGGSAAASMGVDMTSNQFCITESSGICSGTGGSERFVINLSSNNVLLNPYGSGSVGIGTTSPTNKLSISHSGTSVNEYNINLNSLKNVGFYSGISFGDAEGDTVYGGIKFLADAAGDSSIRFLTWDGTAGGTERMVIKGVGGNVGIGTTAPTEKLTVNDGTTVDSSGLSGNLIIATGTSNPAISARDSDDDVEISIATTSTAGWVGTVTSDNLSIMANNAQKMKITTAGQVHIAASGNPSTGVEFDVEGNAECDGAGCWAVESDLSLKENVVDMTKYGLNEIMQIKPREYDYKNAENIDNGAHSFGFIAQELKEIVPEIVYGEEGSMSIGYGGLTPVLVKAIQEQQTQIEKLKLFNTQLKASLCKLGQLEYC